MEKEIWRDVKDYDGLYLVSNLGRVKSLNYRRTGREEILKPSMNTCGYLFVDLSKYGKQKAFLVHRLVAEAFIPNPENLQQINHKDEDKTNNCVWNLECCDYQYNNNYGTHNKRSAEARTNGKCSKRVLQINKDTGEVIREWISLSEVYRQLGYLQENISKCCLGKPHFNTAYGFKWKYA